MSVHLLICNGADVDSLILKGQTPLHLAESNGHIDVVKFLIESGVDFKNMR
jgi:ankyrin repeat protein